MHIETGRTNFTRYNDNEKENFRNKQAEKLVLNLLEKVYSGFQQLTKKL